MGIALYLFKIYWIFNIIFRGILSRRKDNTSAFITVKTASLCNKRNTERSLKYWVNSKPTNQIQILVTV